MSIRITIFSVLISPCLAFAQSGNAKVPVCLHDEICVTLPGTVQLQPIESSPRQAQIIFARHSGSVAHAQAAQYLLQIVPIRRETNDRRLWLDLAQRIGAQHSRVLLLPQRPERYSISSSPESYGSYQRASWPTHNGQAQALYHLLKVGQERYWVVATAVDPAEIDSYTQELLQLMRNITPSP